MFNPLRRAVLIAVSMILTFIVLRSWLLFSPNSNFDVGPYNIHHLYTGMLVFTIAVVPLVLRPRAGRFMDILAIVFGIGMSMAWDEWVYLIATGGSDADYLLPVSFWGGLILVAAVSVYVLLVGWFANRRQHNK